jgi:pimeloyl-ACP methyl ester carboxylesterase
MMAKGKPELLLLHALPLDGSMWTAQAELLPGATYAPALYPLGDRIETWATEALKLTKGNCLIVVGCSIGGSCALEIAAIAQDRIAALVLIGTKANHRPDPAFHASALETLGKDGLETAWQTFWEPLFFKQAAPRVVSDAKSIALRQSSEDVARGITVFHTRPSRDQVLAIFPHPVLVVTGSDDIAPGLDGNRLNWHHTVVCMSFPNVGIMHL